MRSDSLEGVSVAAAYQRLPPPKDTADHGYRFLIYEQRSYSLLTAFSPEDELKRTKILSDYLSPHVEQICGPVAGTQFLSWA